MSNSYRYYKCPKGVRSRYSLLVFDLRNHPFIPLTEFYKQLLGQVSDGTALTYLQALLPFFTWLEQSSCYKGSLVHWEDPPEAIREAVQDYLIQQTGSKVHDHYQGDFKMVRLTGTGEKTIRVFLAAIRNFYKIMIRIKTYIHPNPLIDADAKMYDFDSELQKSGRHRMPDIAGTDPKLRRRFTDAYFKIVGEKWEPVIIDDPLLPTQVLLGGEKAGWRLRDKVIARMLFESGARASEVVCLMIGDYRSRKAVHEMSTFNKGSNGRRVKFLRFSDDTITLLRRYINGERKESDPLGLSFDQLPNDAPLFLTKQGKPYSYNTWYRNWKKGCKFADLDVNPHKTRHWYVTQALREIYETSQTEAEVQLRINELVAYMNWKNKETIEVYEHYFDAKRHAEIQERIFRKMEESTESYLRDRKQLKKPIPKKPEENLFIAASKSEEDLLDDFFS